VGLVKESLQAFEDYPKPPEGEILTCTADKRRIHEKSPIWKLWLIPFAFAIGDFLKETDRKPVRDEARAGVLNRKAL
jgi:hypothetical protein